MVDSTVGTLSYIRESRLPAHHEIDSRTVLHAPYPFLISLISTLISAASSFGASAFAWRPKLSTKRRAFWGEPAGKLRTGAPLSFLSIFCARCHPHSFTHLPDS